MGIPRQSCTVYTGKKTMCDDEICERIINLQHVIRSDLLLAQVGDKCERESIIIENNAIFTAFHS